MKTRDPECFADRYNIPWNLSLVAWEVPFFLQTDKLVTIEWRDSLAPQLSEILAPQLSDTVARLTLFIEKLCGLLLSTCQYFPRGLCGCWSVFCKEPTLCWSFRILPNFGRGPLLVPFSHSPRPGCCGTMLPAPVCNDNEEWQNLKTQFHEKDAQCWFQKEDDLYPEGRMRDLLESPVASSDRRRASSGN